MGGFLACILAGAAMSIQGVMNTRLSEHIGTMETNAFVQCVAAVLSLLVLVFWRTGSFAALGAAPKYCWFGGVLALVFSTVLCAVQALDIFRECYLLAGSYPAREVYTLQHYLYNCFHRGDYASAASALYALLPVIVGLVWLLLRGGCA